MSNWSKEDWIFDKQLSSLYVRILGIAPILAKYDENGNYVTDQVMFWVYYPELRKILVNKEVFNPYNDTQLLSWDDIFEMRFFPINIGYFSELVLIINLIGFIEYLKSYLQFLF